MSTGRAQRPKRGKRVPVRLESYEALRRQMIHETEVSLAYGMRFPDRVPRIPTVEVGTSSFDRRFAEQYWADRLGLNPGDSA